MTGGVTSCPSLSGQRNLYPPTAALLLTAFSFALVSRVGDQPPLASRSDLLCQAPGSPRAHVWPRWCPSFPLLHAPAEVCCKVAPCSDFGQQDDIHSPRLSQRAGGRGERCLGSSGLSFCICNVCRYCVGRSEQYHAHESASHSARGPECFGLGSSRL